MNEVKTVFASYGFELRHSPNFDAILATREIYPGYNPHAAFYANVFNDGDAWRIGIGFYSINPYSDALLVEFNKKFAGGFFISNRVTKEGKPCIISDWLVSKVTHPKPEQALELFLYGLQVLRQHSAIAEISQAAAPFKSKFDSEPTPVVHSRQTADYLIQYQSGRKVLLQGLTDDQAKRETDNARKRNPDSRVKLFKEFY